MLNGATRSLCDKFCRALVPAQKLMLLLVVRITSNPFVDWRPRGCVSIKCLKTAFFLKKKVHIVYAEEVTLDRHVWLFGLHLSTDLGRAKRVVWNTVQVRSAEHSMTIYTCILQLSRDAIALRDLNAPECPTSFFNPTLNFSTKEGLGPEDSRRHLRQSHPQLA